MSIVASAPETDPQPYVRVAPHTAGSLRLLKLGTLEINLDGKRARVNGVVVALPLKEFDLLATLMDNAGRVVSRRELLDAVWGTGYPDGTKTLDVHVKRVREHLGALDPTLRVRLRTVRGMGYIFDLDV